MNTSKFSTNEKRQINSISEQVSDIKSKAHKLQLAIDAANTELDKKPNLMNMAVSNEPFHVYRNEFLGSWQRRETQAHFVEDMTPLVAQILSDLPALELQAEAIREGAAQRTAAIRLLEEQMLLDGDLPPDQRKMLLELKTLAS